MLGRHSKLVLRLFHRVPWSSGKTCKDSCGRYGPWVETGVCPQVMAMFYLGKVSFDVICKSGFWAQEFATGLSYRLRRRDVESDGQATAVELQ